MWILLDFDEVYGPTNVVGPFPSEAAAIEYAKFHPSHPSWAGWEANNYGWILCSLQAPTETR